MSIIYYFMMVVVLTLVNSYVSFESAVIVALAMILSDLWEIGNRLKKKDVE